MLWRQLSSVGPVESRDHRQKRTGTLLAHRILRHGNTLGTHGVDALVKPLMSATITHYPSVIWILTGIRTLG